MYFSVWVLGELKFPRKAADGVESWRRLPLAYAGLSGWPAEGFFSTEGAPDSPTVGLALDRIEASPSAVPMSQPFRVVIKGTTVSLRGFLGKEQFVESHRDLGAAIRRAADVGATGSVVMAEELGDFSYRFRLTKGKSTFEEVDDAEVERWLAAGVIPANGASRSARPPAATPGVTASPAPRPFGSLGALDAELHRRICAALARVSAEAITEAARRAGASLGVQLKAGGRERPLAEVFPDGDALREALCEGAEILELGASQWVDALLRRAFSLLALVDFAAAEAIAIDALAPGRAYCVLRAAAPAILARSTSDEALDALLGAAKDPTIDLDAAVVLGRITNPTAGEKLLAALPSGPVFASSLDRPEEQRLMGRIATALGGRRELRAVPRLLALLRELPVGGLRADVGEALCAIGAPDALMGLADRWDSDHGREMATAARATLLLDPAGAYDRLAHFFDDAELASREGRSAAVTILHVLTQDAVFARTGAPHHGFLASDPRWTDLSLRVLPRDDIGWNALQLLPFARDPRVLPALLARLGQDRLEDLCEALAKLGEPAAIPELERRITKTRKKGDAAKLKALVEALRARP
jgi:hypothetical protein